MKRPLVYALGSLALSSMLLAAGPAAADPPDHAKGWKQARYDVDDRHDLDRHDYDDERYDRYDRDGHYDHDDRDHDRRHYDRHYHRHHDYPRRGYVVTRLPYGHRVVHYRGHRYYYGNGSWYRPYGSRFIVVTPPIGLTIPFRPDFHATLWFGGLPYYEANSVYFVWRPKQHGYVVTPAPW